MYQDRTEHEQHYYGCLTAMDEQIGRLRAELKIIGRSGQHDAVVLLR
jgi:arylsulfatase A-like enzyme